MVSTWSDDLVPRQPSVAAPAPPSPPPAADRSRLWMRVVVLALVVGIALPVASLARGGRRFWPAHWDPRIEPIAQRDASIRQLLFDHPVPVRFLPDKSFVHLLDSQAGSTSATDRTEIDREASTFRALGWIGGSVDLFKAENAASDAGELAFYDFDRKEIIVRGTKLDVSHRATIAHELTHALQDQHFDLPAIEKQASDDDMKTGGSAEAMLALIEGDANHVSDEYVKHLSKADRSAYIRQQVALGRTYTKASADVPPFVSMLFGAPYDFGPLAIRVLVASGGENAVNDALTGPVPTSALFVQAGLVAPPPVGLAAPHLAPGERSVGPSESFGAFETYLVLAMRVDPLRALSAADSVLGGRAQGFRTTAGYCYRIRVETRDGGAASYLGGLERQWARRATRASVTTAGDAVTLTACDPGKRATGPTQQRVTAASTLLEVRGTLTAQIAEQPNASADLARCFSRVIVSTPGVLTRLEAPASRLSGTDRQLFQSLGTQAARRCRDDPGAGLR